VRVETMIDDERVTFTVDETHAVTDYDRDVGE
jgi:hypothetical protein